MKVRKESGLIFDLDGTLWDTCGACAMSWNQVIERNNISFRRITAEDVARVAGKPHQDCIALTFKGLSTDQIDLISRQTEVEDNLMVLKQGGHIYDGVTEGLRELRQKFQLYILSNCQSGYIEVFLKSAHVEDLFHDYECWGNTQKSKAENLKFLIERNQMGQALYIGDTLGDFQAAEDCGVPFLQVTYGFGAPLEGQRQFSDFKFLVKELLSQFK